MSEHDRPVQAARQSNKMLDEMLNTFKECMEIAERKNHDYGGIKEDPFANFKNSTMAGVSVERGILVRLADKMSRISTLLDRDPRVVEESVNDTLNDAINYLAILKAYRILNK
jgi:hypothetical protein